ncbi:Xaa-Pro peptidase family protein [Streptomyces rubellomurinus]|uniref:X-Pro dipeptidase n=2 Tax=Streptomyces TaxID=1883 RepID=A0A0F2TK71_STRR3|nr:aminopeptidase P family protein [Streptomyces rubellomurinus]KJS57159.1 X-Pro dipeptidase [Streptomyces rubellomurinus subsp. indigoferus]KJS62916.1 X-Pro dipeptidase [Streptomyces rubellomurinus]
MVDAYAARRERVREHCGAAGADAALITRAANVRYLTGCAPCGATVLLTREEVLLALPDDLPPDDSGEHLIAPDVAQLPVSAGADTALAAAAAAVRLGVAGLAVEEHDLTVSRHRAVAALAEGARLTDLGQVVERLRVVKDEHEIADLRIAAEIADQALGELLESILVGRTERHLAMELERRMIDHGADRAAFPVSVGTGTHSGQPAHQPTDRRVEEGDFLTVVLGAQYRGYGVSTARTFVIGAAPAPWQVELHRLVFRAQRAGREALEPGVELSVPDRAARQVLEAAGHTEPSPRPIGHGIGLEIREAPRLGPADMGKLDSRVPVTVGPGVHLPGKGGVRIEDTLVVRPLEEGGPELLTITTKELLAL